MPDRALRLGHRNIRVAAKARLARVSSFTERRARAPLLEAGPTYLRCP